MNLVEALELVMELDPGTVLHVDVNKDANGVRTYDIKQVNNDEKGEA